MLTIEILDACNIIWMQLEFGYVALVPGIHQGSLHIGMLQAQSMADLVCGHDEEVGPCREEVMKWGPRDAISVVHVPSVERAVQDSSSSKWTSPPLPSPGGNACANTIPTVKRKHGTSAYLLYELLLFSKEMVKELTHVAALNLSNDDKPKHRQTSKSRNGEANIHWN